MKASSRGAGVDVAAPVARSVLATEAARAVAQQFLCVAPPKQRNAAAMPSSHSAVRSPRDAFTNTRRDEQMDEASKTA